MLQALEITFDGLTLGVTEVPQRDRSANLMNAQPAELALQELPPPSRPQRLRLHIVHHRRARGSRARRSRTARARVVAGGGRTGTGDRDDGSGGDSGDGGGGGDGPPGRLGARVLERERGRDR